MSIAIQNALMRDSTNGGNRGEMRVHFLYILTLAGLPLGAVLWFVIAWLCDRSMPSAGQLFLPLGLLGIVIIALPRRCTLSPFAFRVMLLGLLYLIWIALVQFVMDAPPASWWKHVERGAALGAFMLIATCRVPTSTLLAGMGAAHALGLVISAVPLIYYAGYDETPFFWGFGLGHPNALLNTLGITTCGLSLWLLCERRIGNRKHPWAIWIVAGVGILALLTMTVLLKRRGVLLGIVCGCCALGLDGLWRRWRPMAIAVMLVSIVLVMAMVPYVVSLSLTNPRFERGLIYQVCWELFQQHPFTGQGHFTALKAAFLGTPNAVTLVSWGTWMLHAHSEIVDAALDGGIPALLLGGTLLALIFRHIVRLRPSSERSVFLFVFTAMTAIAAIDNAYSRMIGIWWVAVWAGVLAGVSRQDRTITVSPHWARTIGWPFALLSCWAATTLLGLVSMHKDAYPSVLQRVARQVMDPEMQSAVVSLGLTKAWKEQDISLISDFSERQIESLGPTTTAVKSHVLASLGRGDAALTWGAQAAWSLPFDQDLREATAKVLSVQPNIAPSLPSHLVNCALLAHPELLPERQVQRETHAVEGTPQHAAEIMARVQGMAAQGVSVREMEAVFRPVAERYQAVPEVATMSFRFVIVDEGCTLFRSQDDIHRCLRGLYLPSSLEVLEGVRDPVVAQRIIRFLGHSPSYHDLFQDFALHRIPPTYRENEIFLPLRNALCRLWFLAASRPP